MGSNPDDGIMAFWAWFSRNARPLHAAVVKGLAENDHELMSTMASIIFEQLSAVSDDLVVDLRPEGGTIILAVRGGPSREAMVQRVLKLAPATPGWRFAAGANPDRPVNVIVRDESGRELTIPYDALGFALSNDPAGSTYTVVIVFDGDFELGGSDHMLFQSAAREVLTTFLGPIPSSVGKYAIVPRRMAGGMKTRPIAEIANAWAQRDSQ